MWQSNDSTVDTWIIHFWVVWDWHQGEISGARMGSNRGGHKDEIWCIWFFAYIYIISSRYQYYLHIHVCSRLLEQFSTCRWLHSFAPMCFHRFVRSHWVCPKAAVVKHGLTCLTISRTKPHISEGWARHEQSWTNWLDGGLVVAGCGCPKSHESAEIVENLLMLTPDW